MQAKESHGVSARPRPYAGAGNGTDLNMGVPREAVKPRQVPHLTAARCMKHTNQIPGSTHPSSAYTPANL